MEEQKVKCLDMINSYIKDLGQLKVHINDVGDMNEELKLENENWKKAAEELSDDLEILKEELLTFREYRNEVENRLGKDTSVAIWKNIVEEKENVHTMER